LLKFGTEFDHVTPDVLQMFKIKGFKDQEQPKVGLSAVKQRG